LRRVERLEVRGGCVDGRCCVIRGDGAVTREGGSPRGGGGRLAADIMVIGWVGGKKRKRIGET
jgi:hypothetical protein